MKLKIKQKTLIEHLNYVIRGISNKNLIPILNCIKLELKSEGLYLLSTDNDIAIKSFIFVITVVVDVFKSAISVKSNDSTISLGLTDE